MRNPRSLNIRHLWSRQEELNKYLGVFQGTNQSNQMGEFEMNEMLFYSVPNVWIKQA